MNSTVKNLISRRSRFGLAVLSLTLMYGCETLRPAVEPHPNFFSLATSSNTAQAVPRAPATAPTLIVSPPHDLSDGTKVTVKRS